MSAELLKVLYCSFDVLPEPTGTSARATDFIRGLTPLFNVDGLTVKSADHAHIERYCGMRLMRVPVGAGDLPVRAQTFERAVRRQLESDEYQLVHFTDPYGGYALCELRGQYTFKLVYEVVGLPSVEVKYTHPHLENDRRFMSKLRRQELFCLMNADAVLVGSDQTAAMVQSLGVSTDRTTVIRACADISLYSPIDQMAKPDRVPMRILYLGNQNAWQGLGTLLFSMSIASQLADVRLAIVGPQHPTWRLQLEEMVKYRKLSGLVEFIDPVASDDLPKILTAADVGVAPLEKNDRNTVQGAPITKIAHYLAAGRPVIAANLPIVREITSESCTLYHEPGDENDLAEKIVTLARDPARRVAMGERAHAFAKEKLHADNARTGLLKLYSTMLGGVTGPAQQPHVEGEASYAPTSVGASALDDDEGDAHTQNAEVREVAEARDHTTDPFRKMAGAPEDDLASRDGPLTPRGLSVLPAVTAENEIPLDIVPGTPEPTPPPSLASPAEPEPTPPPSLASPAEPEPTPPPSLASPAEPEPTPPPSSPHAPAPSAATPDPLEFNFEPPAASRPTPAVEKPVAVLAPPAIAVEPAIAAPPPPAPVEEPEEQPMQMPEPSPDSVTAVPFAGEEEPPPPPSLAPEMHTLLDAVANEEAPPEELRAEPAADEVSPPPAPVGEVAPQMRLAFDEEASHPELPVEAAEEPLKVRLVDDSEPAPPPAPEAALSESAEPLPFEASYEAAPDAGRQEVPWELEPQGEAERLAALREAVALPTPPVSEPPPSVPARPAARVPETKTDEVFELEEVLKPKPAPAALPATERSILNATTLKLPVFPAEKPTAPPSSFGQTAAPAKAPPPPAASPKASLTPPPPAAPPKAPPAPVPAAKPPPAPPPAAALRAIPAPAPAPKPTSPPAAAAPPKPAPLARPPTVGPPQAAPLPAARPPLSPMAPTPARGFPPVLMPGRPPGPPGGPPRLEPVARQATASPTKAPPVLYAQGQRPAAPPAPIATSLPRLARLTPGSARTDVPPVMAAAGRASGVPASDAPVEIEASDIEMLDPHDGVTPLSGLAPPDEWLGHVLLGYAPFGVTVMHRTTSREFPMLEGDGVPGPRR